jgi:cell wall-associated NlpC family hydrolase
MIRTTTFLLILSLPASAAAQGLHFTPFAARDGGLRGASGMLGLSATAYTGAFGVRIGGAMDAPSTPLASMLGHQPSPVAQAWSGDLDMVLSGARAGVTLGSVEPSLFTGFGVHGLRRSDGTTATIPVWSYGAMAAMPIARWLSLDVEARYRMPHESRAERRPTDVGGGWELRTGLTLRLGSSGRARSSPTAPAPRPRREGADGARGDSGVGAAAVATMTIHTADRYVGVPYVWGGSTPQEGFDCSGFVQYVYGRNGIRLPRVSRDQARAGRWVVPDLSTLRDGDLLFFSGADGVIDHVAIYVGDHTILHSAASRGAVGYDRLDSRRGRWYATHLVAVRRVIGN